MSKKQKAIELIKEKLNTQRDFDQAIEKAVEKTAKNMELKYSQEVNIPKSVVIDGLHEELVKAFKQEEIFDGLEDKELHTRIENDVLKVSTDKTEVEGQVDIGNTVEAQIANTEDVKQPDNTSGLISFLVGAFDSLFDLLGDMQRRVFTVQPTQESFRTPQRIVMVDPDTMEPMTPGEMIEAKIDKLVGGGGGALSAPKKVGIRGSSKIGTGSTTVSTSGTAVQLPDQTIDRVYVQANINNSGDVVIGDSNVVADASNRQGLALTANQWQPFTPKNLNQLYVDATSDGDKVDYIYEYED